MTAKHCILRDVTLTRLFCVAVLMLLFTSSFSWAANTNGTYYTTFRFTILVYAKKGSSNFRCYLWYTASFVFLLEGICLNPLDAYSNTDVTCELV